MTQKQKTPTREELENRIDRVAERGATFTAIFLVLFLVAIGILILLSLRYQDLKQENSALKMNCPVVSSEQINPPIQVLDYNYTRCVFTFQEKIVVCNILMYNTCKERERDYNPLDKNCEVIK